jgi:adenylyltransferase/sulfurtransferase
VGYPPSSPAMALFRDGQLVHMLERHDIEGVDGKSLSKVITSMFDKYCGPTINESVKIADPMGDMEIEPKALAEAFKSGKIKNVLDCRDEFEREKANIEGSQLLTQELAEKILETWDKNEEVVIYCHLGQRSFQAVRYFRQHGFDQVKSLRGGISAWSREVDSSIPVY